MLTYKKRTSRCFGLHVSTILVNFMVSYLSTSQLFSTNNVANMLLCALLLQVFNNVSFLPEEHT